MINNRDFRHSKDFVYDGEEASNKPILPKRQGSKPTVTKSKFAGKCSHGFALFFVNGNSYAEHIITPADDAKIVSHKSKCDEGQDLTR